MLRVKLLKNEPNTVQLDDIGTGSLFKTQQGQIVYMVIVPHDNIKIQKNRIPAISLHSGQIHFFNKTHPIVELDGALEVSRIKLERRK